MSGLPDPLVPPEVDLRGIDYMPLRGDLLFKSTTWLKSSPEARSVALRLWWHAFAHEVPAASLPDDDALLADHVACKPRVWRGMREQVLRGFIKCSDGRLYHPLVAELALGAWSARRKARDRVRRHRAQRNETVTQPLRNGPKVKAKVEEGERHAVSLRVPRATAIAGDWQPSEEARERLRASRPDLTPETIALRLVEFRAWCAANNRTTFNPDATWLGFMVKTHEQRSRPANNARPNAPNVDDTLAGYARGGRR
jgi:hypothetical protein